MAYGPVWARYGICFGVSSLLHASALLTFLKHFTKPNEAPKPSKPLSPKP